MSSAGAAALPGTERPCPTCRTRIASCILPAVDDNATVYINGKQMIHHEGWNEAFDVPLDAVWKRGGPNVVTVLVENTAGAGGITGQVILGTPTSPVAVGDPSRCRV